MGRRRGVTEQGRETWELTLGAKANWAVGVEWTYREKKNEKRRILRRARGILEMFDENSKSYQNYYLVCKRTLNTSAFNIQRD
jgi:hypothetical protein